MIRLASLLAVLAGAVSAQEDPPSAVAVQSGEHATFTRLAIFSGGAGDWRFGRTEDGYALLLPGAPGFDIGRVFNTIPRSRIGDLRSVPGRLNITTDCACHARVFRHAGEWLVVDIVDGAATADSAFEAPLSPGRAPLDRGTLPLLAGSATGSPLLPALGWRPDTLGPSAADQPAPASPHPAALEIRGQMAESLMRAADQGLLELAGPLSAATVPETAPPVPVMAIPEPVMPARPPGLPGIAAHTAVDLARAGGALATGETCPNPRDFDLAAWAGSGDFLTETARGWAALTDDMGQVDPASANDLARTHVAFGFGREALAILSLDPTPSGDRHALSLLARIVDGETVPLEGFVARPGCAGPDALWRVLGRDQAADLTEGEAAAISTAYLLLPDALRWQIGPRLAVLFAEAGDPLAAQEFLARAHAPEAQASPDAGLAAVGADLASGAPDTALDRLETLVESDSRMGPEAMVALVDIAIAEGRLPDPGDLSLLRALRFEYRGREEEAALIRAESRLLSATGDHSGALALAARLPATDRAGALGEAVIALATSAEDATFLEIAFASEFSALPPAAANALAARMIALGFPDKALAHLGPIAAGPDLAERRYLRAEAAALLGRHDLVEAELLGLTDDRAAAIRARAGVEESVPTGDLNPAGAITDAAAPDGPPVTPVAVDLPPLAARGALIAEAEAVRLRALELLESRPIP